MSKDYTFNPGDFVVYPAHGLGQVTERTENTVGGQAMDCLMVHFNKDGLKLTIPVQSALKNGLRQIATPVTMETVETVLSKKIKTKRIPWNKRSAEYNVKIKSGDPVALAEVIRELYKDPAIATQTYSEGQLYDEAMGRLVPEYAKIKGIDSEAEAKTRLEELLAGKDSAA